MARMALLLGAIWGLWLGFVTPVLAQHDLRREDMSVSGRMDSKMASNPYVDPPNAVAQTPGLSGALLLQNRKRLFSFHRPAFVQQDGPIPLVIVLHDGGGSPERMADITLFNQLADRQGFLVAYPSAIDRFWNDGRKNAPGDKSIDDVAFLVALRDHMVKSFHVDPQRVYLVGLADGGMMAMRAACEATRAFAAIASVSASMPVDLAKICQPTAQIPVMMIAGTSDPIIPYKGGEVNLFDETAGKIVSVDETANAWQLNNGCSAGPKTKDMLDRDRDDGSVVKIHRWMKCRAAAEVVLYEIERGGYTWPGTGRQLAQLRKFILGRPNMDFDASAEIWQFFNRFKRPVSPFDLSAVQAEPAG